MGLIFPPQKGTDDREQRGQSRRGQTTGEQRQKGTEDRSAARTQKETGSDGDRIRWGQRTARGYIAPGRHQQTGEKHGASTDREKNQPDAYREARKKPGIIFDCREFRVGLMDLFRHP